MVQGELPTIDTGGEISSANVQSGTGGTKSKSKYRSTRFILGGGNNGVVIDATKLNDGVRRGCIWGGE